MVCGRRGLRILLVRRSVRGRCGAQRESDSAQRVFVHRVLQIELIRVDGIFAAVGCDVVQLASSQPVIADRVTGTVAQNQHDVGLRACIIGSAAVIAKVAAVSKSCAIAKSIAEAETIAEARRASPQRIAAESVSKSKSVSERRKAKRIEGIKNNRVMMEAPFRDTSCARIICERVANGFDGGGRGAAI